MLLVISEEIVVELGSFEFANVVNELSVELAISETEVADEKYDPVAVVVAPDTLPILIVFEVVP